MYMDLEKEKIIKAYLSELGKKGGSVKSERKARASAENGKKGGRPKRRKEADNE
jgi:hypothetical protein